MSAEEYKSLAEQQQAELADLRRQYEAELLEARQQLQQAQALPWLRQRHHRVISLRLVRWRSELGFLKTFLGK